jgi:L-lactate dehydrogenase complex protein LldG
MVASEGEAGMTDSRATGLDTIREHLTKGVLPGARRERPIRPPALQEATGPVDLATTFAAELQAAAGQAYLPASPAEALGILLSIVRSHAAEVALAWDGEHMPLPGVRKALAEAGVQLLDATLPVEPAARAARLEELDRAVVGVTGALAGLADTGSVALASGPGRGRVVSLLPPVHIALLPVAKLYPSMAAFLADHPDLTRQASSLIFVTGPSRTADIEQVLTLGVHGPREIHVLLL